MTALLKSSVGQGMTNWVISRIFQNSFTGGARELARRSIPYFYPRCRVRVVKNFRYSVEVTPIFPDYLFIFSPGRWYHLQEIPGIISFVKFVDDQPYRSNALDEEVHDMMRTVDADGFCPAPDAMRIKSKLGRFVKNDNVQIVSGAFSGISGVVEDVSGSKVTVSSGGARVRTDEDHLVLMSVDDVVNHHLSKGRSRRMRHMQSTMA